LAISVAWYGLRSLAHYKPELQTTQIKTELEFQSLLQECAASTKEQRRSALSKRYLPRTLVAVFLSITFNLLVRRL